VIRLGSYTLMFYRYTYGGVDWIPTLFLTEDYKDFSWLLWIFSITKDDTEDLTKEN